MKKIAIILTTIIFGLLLHSQLAHAEEIYKWIDEKGTTHYSDNPNAVPEKYKNKAQKKDIDEFPPLVPDKPERPQSFDSKPLSNTTESSRPVRLKVREDQIPGRSQKEKEPQYSLPLLAYDPTNDPEYQQMIKKLNKSIYYQRDIYQPGTQRVRSRAGELIPGGPDAAQNLKEELDRLVSNPQFGRDTQYRRDVRNFFDSHFYEKDEYFSGTQSIRHSRGEIKSVSSNREKFHQISGATSMEAIKSIEHHRLFNPATGHFLTKQGDGYFDYKTSQTWKETGNGLFNPFTGERMNATGNGYIDTKTGQTWIKQ